MFISESDMPNENVYRNIHVILFAIRLEVWWVHPYFVCELTCPMEIKWKFSLMFLFCLYHEVKINNAILICNLIVIVDRI